MSGEKHLTLTDSEVRFVHSQGISRLATSSKDGMPHVVPVSHLFRDGCLYIAVDYGTKKLTNLKENPKAALVVDVARPMKAVMVQGPVKIIENGMEWREVYKDFHSKYQWVRSAPWKEGEAPFVKIIPSVKASWGVKGRKRTE